MANYSEQYDQLLLLSQEKGYITYDDILTYGEKLSPVDIDRLTESLQLHGVLIQESEPEKADENEDLTDFSRTNYDSIYKQIIAMSPNLKGLICDIKKIPPIQKGAIPVLTAQLENGNAYARDQLIRMHMRLVLKIALSMTNQYDLDIEDAVFSGFIGLIEGIDSFNRNGFNHLLQNVSFRILQKIQRECMPEWFTIQIAYKKRDVIRYIFTDYKEHYCECCLSSAICPEFEKETIQKYGLKEEEAHHYISLIMLFSQNRQYTDLLIDSFELEYGIFLLPAFSKNNFIQEKLLKHLQGEVIQNIFQEIPYREAKVLKYRYGFLSDHPYTLDECGNILGITRERARQIEKSGIAHIKNSDGYRLLCDLFL